MWTIASSTTLFCFVFFPDYADAGRKHTQCSKAANFEAYIISSQRILKLVSKSVWKSPCRRNIFPTVGFPISPSLHVLGVYKWPPNFYTCTLNNGASSQPQRSLTLGQNILYMMHFHLPSGGNVAGENLRNDQHYYQLIWFWNDFFSIAGDRK